MDIKRKLGVNGQKDLGFYNESYNFELIRIYELIYYCTIFTSNAFMISEMSKFEIKFFSRVIRFYDNFLSLWDLTMYMVVEKRKLENLW